MGQKTRLLFGIIAVLENRIRKNERGKGMSKKEVRENPGNLNYVIFGYIRFGFERSTSLLRMP